MSAHVTRASIHQRTRRASESSFSATKTLFITACSLNWHIIYGAVDRCAMGAESQVLR